MKPIIALDADGVLLNYHHVYAHAWGKLFGTTPALRDPDAYWLIDRWEVRKLEEEELTQFRTAFDNHYAENPSGDLKRGCYTSQGSARNC
jgi:hypothetical protein